MSGDSKKVDEGWQKKAGLDLRLAKPQIYKDELSNSRKENRVVPKTNSAQVHANVGKRLKKKKVIGEEEQTSSQEEIGFKTKSAHILVNVGKKLKKRKVIGEEELTCSQKEIRSKTRSAQVHANIGKKLKKKKVIGEEELTSSQKEIGSKTNSAQVHANVGEQLKKGKAISGEELLSSLKGDISPDNAQSWHRVLYAKAKDQFQNGEALSEEQLVFRECVKKRALKKLKKLPTVIDIHKRVGKLRQAEGCIFCVLEMGGDFDADEADFIVRCAIRHHERPGRHPLQNSILDSELPKFASKHGKHGTISNAVIYAYRSLKQALARQGFFLNLGSFSASESMTVMKNFEHFLVSKGRKTGPCIDRRIGPERVSRILSEA